MKSNRIRLLAFAGALVVCPAFAAKNAPLELGGIACITPPPMHCPDANCGALVTEFILALHGGGSYGNWQRYYFPIVDYKTNIGW